MKSIKKCVICETAFDANSRNFGRGRQTYCGPRCRQVANNRRHWRRRNPPKTEEELRRLCVVCGVQFITDPTHSGALTCSVKCNEARMNAMRRRQSAQRLERAKRECAICGLAFMPNKFGVGKTKYCSPECAKIATARRSVAADTRPYNRRLNGSAWKRAKKQAIERDGGKCRACGVECKPHVHHAFYRTEAEMNDHGIDNLICLCGTCHRKIHDIRIGKDGDEFVISGLVFSVFGITKVRIG